MLPVPQVERCPREGKTFCSCGRKIVPFCRTRIAYLYQQADADLQKKKKRSLRQIGLLFFEFSV